VKAGLEMWLESGYFDEDGRQIKTLESCRELLQRCWAIDA
jgi:hypothetical protein